MMAYQDYFPELRIRHPWLAEDFALFNGVSDVLAWMQRRNLCSAAVDMIGMDEFEYDFLIELHPDGDWLALGIT